MLKEIEDAFQAVTKVVLGKPLPSLQSYEKWLYENQRQPQDSKSAISGKTIHNPPLRFYPYVTARAVKEDEFMELGTRHISKQDVEKLELSNAAQVLENIRYYTPEAIVGQNIAVEECTLYFDSSYCYKVNSLNRVKFCAYSFWPREAEYLFGVDTVFNSKFVLKCYCSTNLTRCFEVANSTNCSDCYFCYNCDALSDCMFCFNTKSKRYAISNVEYPKEEYLHLKKLLLGQIASKLEKDKRLSLSIFNVGCKK